MRAASAIACAGMVAVAACGSRTGLFDNGAPAPAPTSDPLLCGNGRLDPGEACDDGNRNDFDACDNACKLPVCGDRKLAGAEQCDLGPDNGDRPAFLVTQPSGVRFGTNPLVQSRSAVEFYD